MVWREREGKEGEGRWRERRRRGREREREWRHATHACVREVQREVIVKEVGGFLMKR